MCRDSDRTCSTPSTSCKSLTEVTGRPIEVTTGAVVDLKLTCATDRAVYVGACDIGGVPDDDLFEIRIKETGKVITENRASTIEGEIVRILPFFPPERPTTIELEMLQDIAKGSLLKIVATHFPDTLESQLKDACGADFEELVIEPPPPEPVVNCTPEEGIDTAIGCVPYPPAEMAAFFLKWALGIGGGIAFLNVLRGGYLVATSTGDPAKLAEGKDLILSAIGGLMLIVFTVFLLRFLGQSVLGII